MYWVHSANNSVNRDLRTDQSLVGVTLGHIVPGLTPPLSNVTAEHVHLLLLHTTGQQAPGIPPPSVLYHILHTEAKNVPRAHDDTDHSPDLLLWLLEPTIQSSDWISEPKKSPSVVKT